MISILKKTTCVFTFCLALMLIVQSCAPPPAVQADTDVIVKRSWNSDHYENRDGTITASIKPKWINYMEADESWQPIDNHFIDKGTHFEVDKAPFIAKAPKFSTGTAYFVSNNRWDIFDKKKIDEVPLTMEITANDVAKVPGVIETSDLGWGETNYIIYRNAYPDLDADLIYWVHNGIGTRLRKLVRFNSNPNAIDDLRISFNLKFDNEIEIKNEGYKWGKDKILKTKDRISHRLQSATESRRGIGLRQFYVWEEGVNNKQKINVEYEKVGQKYRLIKIILKDYLDNAVYPVYTDASASFNPDADPESTTVDGEAHHTGNEMTWSNLVAAAGTSSDDSNDGSGVPFIYIEADTVTDTWDNLYRGIALLDTSSLGAGASVSAADFNLYATSVGGALTTSELDINIYSSNPASNTAVASGDYDSLGTTAYSDSAINWDSIATSSYNTWDFNATGRAAIDVDGITKLGIREATRDVADTAPTWGSNNGAWFYASTADKGSNEPRLDVTYSTGWAGGSSYSGVASGSISTVDGVATANISTINGI